MHIKIDEKEYNFKDEPSTRDLITIGMPPSIYRLMASNKAANIPLPEAKDSDMMEILEYNGKILNTLCLEEEIEDWLDQPKSLMNKAMITPEILELIKLLYG